MKHSLPPLLTVWILALAVPQNTHSQPERVFNTLAGYPGRANLDGTGNYARFQRPWGIAADSAGNLYVSDTEQHTIRKLTPAGVVQTIAGSPGQSGISDGEPRIARFNHPKGLGVDNSGSLYVADSLSHTVRRILPSGITETFAGTPGTSGNADGTGSGASFNHPTGIAVDEQGTIYVADSGNHTIRKISSSGSVMTLAGAAGVSGSSDGSGTEALFSCPQGIAVNTMGIVFVADYGNGTVRKISPSGTVVTLAGKPGVYGTSDGTGTNASFYYPVGITIGAQDILYISDSFNHIVRRITATGAVSTYAGVPGQFGFQDGTFDSARFHVPAGIVYCRSNVFVCDAGNGSVRALRSFGIVETPAGSPSAGIQDGVGRDARLHAPAGLTIDGQGTLFVADSANAVIRKVEVPGPVTTLAGYPENPGSADGAGEQAAFNSPQGLATDIQGNIFVADTGNHTIRKVDSQRSVTTLAGYPGDSGCADGQGQSARFSYPQGIAVDTSGTLYVADTANHTIRKVSQAGIVTTLAGFAGQSGSADGEGPQSRFNRPAGLAVNSGGNVFVADTLNHTVRQVSPTGVTVTLAGLPGISGYTDGSGRDARFFRPQSVALDSFGNIYVADSGNHAIRKLEHIETNWVASTIAGLGTPGLTDGDSSHARFNFPVGVAVDRFGYLYITDMANNTLRVNRMLPPALVASRAIDALILSWPDASGYRLEMNVDFAQSSGWVPVNDSPATLGNLHAVNVDPAGPQKFYRLRAP